MYDSNLVPLYGAPDLPATMIIERFAVDKTLDAQLVEVRVYSCAGCLFMLEKFWCDGRREAVAFVDSRPVAFRLAVELVQEFENKCVHGKMKAKVDEALERR